MISVVGYGLLNDVHYIAGTSEIQHSVHNRSFYKNELVSQSTIFETTVRIITTHLV